MPFQRKFLHKNQGQISKFKSRLAAGAKTNQDLLVSWQLGGALDEDFDILLQE
jgi:hypothetical protein